MTAGLKKLKLFREFPDQLILRLETVIEERSYPRGSVIFSEGVPGDCLYVIKSGEVAINKLIDVQEQSYKTLATLFSGDFFGEMALVDNVPRSASAVAVNNTVLMRLNRDEFNNILGTEPQSAVFFLSALLQTVVGRLRRTDTELITVYETGKIIAAVTDLTVMCRLILDRILNTMEHTELGLIALWNEFTEEFDSLACIGCNVSVDEDFKISIPINDPLVKWLIHHRERLVIRNLAMDRRFPGLTDQFFYGKSIVACPFVSLDSVLGFIILTDKNEEDAFTTDQINMVSGIAAQISAAIENLKFRSEEAARVRLSEQRYI